jgi:hypothetical protein
MGALRPSKTSLCGGNPDPIRTMAVAGAVSVPAGGQQELVVLRIRMMFGRLNSACANTPGMMLREP